MATARTDTLLPADALLRRMQDTVRLLEENHDAHVRHLERMTADIASAAQAVPGLESALSLGSARYSFFQETRGYVQDLLGCLDEKVPLIDEQVSYDGHMHIPRPTLAKDPLPSPSYRSLESRSWTANADC